MKVVGYVVVELELFLALPLSPIKNGNDSLKLENVLLNEEHECISASSLFKIVLLGQEDVKGRIPKIVDINPG